MATAQLLKELQDIRAATERAAALLAARVTPAHLYRDNPVLYCTDKLHVSLTPDQERILTLMVRPPRRVLVPSGHNTGKTFLAAAAISWWFDSYDPGAVFTIGPRHDSLKDTIWGEVRRQRARAGLPDHFIGPQAPEMRTSTDHWAKAFTAAKDASLTGRHLPHMLFVIEEACAVDPIWWEVIMTMFDASLGHCQLCIFNPTDTGSQAYREDLMCDDTEGEPRWSKVQLSCLDHPNVVSQLKGGPKLVPYAVSLEQVTSAVRDMCEPVEHLEDVRATDIEFPPAGNLVDLTGQLGPCRYWRPGPEFQARWLGEWPEAGAGVWSPALWRACFPLHEPALDPRFLPQIGVDCAQGKGQDYYALHARWGAVSLYHETSNTMDAVHIQNRIVMACRAMAEEVDKLLPVNQARTDPHRVVVRIDDDGTGNAIAAHLKRERYAVQLVSVARKSSMPEQYRIMRDEAWFHSAQRARAGLISLCRLEKRTLARLRQQLLTPTYRLNLAGQREVETKEELAQPERLGRSPDDADAFNLSYLDLTGVIQGQPIENETRQPMTSWGQPDDLKVSGRARMYGRGE